MKNFDAIKLFNFLKEPEAGNITFTEVKSFFQFKRNIKSLEEYVKTIADLEKEFKTPSDTFVKYEQIKIEQVTPFLKRDESGKLIVDQQGGSPIVEGSDDRVRSIILALNEEYKEAIEERVSKLQGWEKFLQTDAEFELFMIPASTLKLHDKMDAKQFDALSLMLDEDN